MEHDKVVVKSTPDEDEDHEPEDLAVTAGKLADKIPGKDTFWDMLQQCWKLGLFHPVENIGKLPFHPARRTARVPRSKTWTMTMTMLDFRKQLVAAGCWL